MQLPCGIALTLPTVILGAVCLLAPSESEAACGDRSIAASAVRVEADVEAFVRCALELIQELGVNAAYEAFHNDPRWKSGPTYVFAVESIPRGSQAKLLLFPPDPAREATQPVRLTDRGDAFSTASHAEAVRIIQEFGGGWWYHQSTNPATGSIEPKSSFILPADWNGTPAFIGSGVYRRDFPGACKKEDVNAGLLESDPTDGRLEELVRCAAMEVESQGFLAFSALQDDERWASGSVYVFGVDLMGNQMFTGSKAQVDGEPIPEWEPRGTPADQFEDRDVVGVVSAFGEAYLYYSALNPLTGRSNRKVTFLKRVMAGGVPILVGAGYFVESESSRTTQVTLPNGAMIEAELAVTREERARGLMFRTELAPDRGMLFVGESPARRPIWMFQCLIPLDIIWLDGEHQIVDIVHSAPPCPSENSSRCPLYGGTTSSVYVLELAGGQADRHGLRIGDRLDF